MCGGRVCACVCLGTQQHSMNLTVRWTHDKRAGWWLMSHHSAYSIQFLHLFSTFVLFLKPFYKCLQCCVICNWIRVQQQSWQTGHTLGGRSRRATHGLTEKFAWEMTRVLGTYNRDKTAYEEDINRTKRYFWWANILQTKEINCRASQRQREMEI